MLRQFRKYITDHSLLSGSAPVLVCVSGGADSVALLELFLRCGQACVVAHCNFHLRGKESARDEIFVNNLCERFRQQYKCDLPLFIKHFETKSYAEQKGISIEMAARQLRYQWFAHLAEIEGCQAIAVAHHKNDQAETLLLNLYRGSGIRGMMGMHAKSNNPMVKHSVPIIRPMLCTTRDYIEHYLHDIRHIDWIVDSTNTDTTILRNAVRRQLQQSPKSYVDHLSETATMFQSYGLIIDDYIKSVAAKICQKREDELVIDIKKLLELPTASVVLYELLRPYGFSTIDQIYAAAQRGKGGKIFNTDNYIAKIIHNKICVHSV